MQKTETKNSKAKDVFEKARICYYVSRIYICFTESFEIAGENGRAVDERGTERDREEPTSQGTFSESTQSVFGIDANVQGRVGSRTEPRTARHVVLAGSARSRLVERRYPAVETGEQDGVFRTDEAGSSEEQAGEPSDQQFEPTQRRAGSSSPGNIGRRSKATAGEHDVGTPIVGRENVQMRGTDKSAGKETPRRSKEKEKVPSGIGIAQAEGTGDSRQDRGRRQRSGTDGRQADGVSAKDPRVHQEDQGSGFASDGRVQQVQDHVSEAAVQATGKGQHRTEKVFPRQQKGPRSVHLVLGAKGEVDEPQGRVGSRSQEDSGSDGRFGTTEERSHPLHFQTSLEVLSRSLQKTRSSGIFTILSCNCQVETFRFQGQGHLSIKRDSGKDDGDDRDEDPSHKLENATGVSCAVSFTGNFHAPSLFSVCF